MSQNLSRTRSFTKTSPNSRLNYSEPQFSPTTPQRDRIPFGAPLVRKEISEPLACSTRRLEFMKARDVFEKTYVGDRKDSKAPNSDTVTSDIESFMPSETPVTRNHRKIKRDYGRELEDRFKDVRIKQLNNKGDYAEASANSGHENEETSEKLNLTYDSETLQQKLDEMSFSQDNASYYTEVSSIVPEELDQTHMNLRTNGLISKEILERIDQLKTQINIDCDILEFYRNLLVGNGSAEELKANRDLLRHLSEFVALKKELYRIDEYNEVKVAHPLTRRNVYVDLDVMRLRIKLNKNYYMGAIDESTSYAFLALIKCGTTVVCSQPCIALNHGTMRMSTLSFNEPLRLERLPIDFNAIIEIYEFKIHDRPTRTQTECIFACNHKKRKDISKDMQERQLNDRPHWLESEFQKCGWMIVTNEMLGRNRYLMHDVEYPAEGTIEVTVNCSPLPPVFEIPIRGYLKIHQYRHNRKPEWVRFFCELLQGSIKFFKNESEAANLLRPFAVLSLSDVYSREIAEAPDKTTDDTFVFYLDYVSTGSNGKLISRRILLSTNTESERTKWRSHLNQMIKFMNSVDS